jgi:diguanylate cyclase (GGDEF)-like protein
MNSENINKEILVIDKNEISARLIAEKISDELGFRCSYKKNFAEAKYFLENDNPHIFVTILDLNLNDADQDESINYILSKEIPLIVTTSSSDDNIRERILNKNIIDYFIKKDYGSIDQLIKIIRNIIRNQKLKVLLIDDSEISRRYISRLLKTQLLTVIDINSGKDALKILEDNKEIKLLITDYNMPEINGIELLNKIRTVYSMDKLSIIGISAYGNALVSANFIKEGANDFIYKPFSDEEFKWRINQNIEMMDYINKLKDLSTRDFLTGLYNRRALFDIGNNLFENAKRGNIEITIAIIDIDDFKKINDKYGHLYGDMVLQHVSDILRANFRSSDLITRYGGEEFCIISVNLMKKNSFQHFEKIRKLIENSIISTNKGDIILTVSTGIVNSMSENLESSISKADELLYQSKKKGKNCLSIDCD